MAVAHCEALMLVLVPDTGNWYKVEGFELVANPMLNPEQLPEVVQLNVCGKLREAPLAGLFNVAEHAALALLTAPTISVPEIANAKNKRPRIEVSFIELRAGRCGSWR